MGAQAEGQVCADLGARTPIGASGNFFKGKVWSKMRLDRLVVYVKDRQTAIFFKAKNDFLINSN